MLIRHNGREGGTAVYIGFSMSKIPFCFMVATRRSEKPRHLTGASRLMAWHCFTPSGRRERFTNLDFVAILPARFSIDGLLMSSIRGDGASRSVVVQFRSSTATKESRPYATTGFFLSTSSIVIVRRLEIFWIRASHTSSTASSSESACLIRCCTATPPSSSAPAVVPDCTLATTCRNLGSEAHVGNGLSG